MSITHARASEELHDQPQQTLYCILKRHTELYTVIYSYTVTVIIIKVNTYVM